MRWRCANSWSAGWDSPEIAALVEATLEAAERAGITAEPASLEDAIGIDQAGRSMAAALLPEIAAKAS